MCHFFITAHMSAVMANDINSDIFLSKFVQNNTMRSLHKSTNLADIYFNQKDRISRPMQLLVHWGRWVGGI